MGSCIVNQLTYKSSDLHLNANEVINYPNFTNRKMGGKKELVRLIKPIPLEETEKSVQKQVPHCHQQRCSYHLPCQIDKTVHSS